MSADAAARVKTLISNLDWTLYKGSAVVTAGMILARGVGFIVTLLLARLFEPAGFGEIQYAISLAGIMAIGTQPLGQHVLAKYVSMGGEDDVALRRVLANFWLVAGIVLGVSSLLGMAVLFIAGKYSHGVMAIFIGSSLFYFYWGLARGAFASWKMLAADVGTNIVKVVLIFWLIQSMGMRSTMLAMFVYGLSCLIPLALLQYFQPLPAMFDARLLSRADTFAIAQFALPVILSHAGYMVYMTIAIIFLEYYTNTASVGVYSLALTLSIMFSFLPTGLATFLMPKISAAHGQAHGRMLLSALGLALAANLALLVVYYFLVPLLIGELFDPGYLVVPQVFVSLGMVTVLTGVHTIISAVFVGQSRAQEETKSRLICVLVTAFFCWLLIPRFQIMGAVAANLLGIVSGLCVYAVIFLFDRFPRRLSHEQSK